MTAPWIQHAKTVPLHAIARDIGLPVRGTSIQCPSCRRQRRSSTDRRPLSATFGRSGGWRCHHPDCRAGGDGSDLVAYMLTGDRLGTDPRQRKQVAEWLANHGHILPEHADAAARTLRALPPPPPDPSEDWPDRGQVEEIWRACQPVADDPACVRWLTDRYGAHAERLLILLDHFGIVRSLPAISTPRWARFGGRTWRQGGYRLIFPLSDATGQLRSLRARRVWDAPTPKAIPAAGFGCRGLVLACDRARALLSGAQPPASWPTGSLFRVCIVEGETDWMSWLALRRHITDPALIGVYSGAWLPEHSAALPPSAIVAIRTDDNEAGHRYAEAIVRASRKRRDLTLIRAGVA